MNDDMNAVDLATELTVAWLSNPNTRTNAEDVPSFLKTMYDAVSALSNPTVSEATSSATEYTGAVTARKSLASNDHIISMIDGKPYKTLRRHLSTHGLTPEQYRDRYNLKSDYPMVATSYSDARREMAKRIGLGRKPGTKMAAKEASPAKAPRAKKATADA